MKRFISTAILSVIAMSATATENTNIWGCVTNAGKVARVDLVEGTGGVQAIYTFGKAVSDPELSVAKKLSDVKYTEKEAYANGILQTTYYQLTFNNGQYSYITEQFNKIARLYVLKNDKVISTIECEDIIDAGVLDSENMIKIFPYHEKVKDE